MAFHIESAGSGPAILFLHAGVADTRMWRDQMGLDGFRTIAYDRRGFGQTPAPTEGFSDRGDALAVLDELGVESAIVVGCSMGGGLALELAIENPDRVDRLVLVGTAPGGWVPEDGWEDHPLWEEAVAALKEGNLERVAEIDFEMWVVGYGRTGEGIDSQMRELFLDMDRAPLASEAKRDELSASYEKKHNEHLDEISAPTLVIVGAHDEAFLIKAASYLAERLSDRPETIVDGAAHLPSLEQPAEFNRALLDFLESS